MSDERWVAGDTVLAVLLVTAPLSGKDHACVTMRAPLRCAAALKAGRGDAKLTERKSIGVKIARGGGSVAMQRVTATVLPSAKTVRHGVG
eukprot:353793-Chlamydomonas_euryale.AAC.6